MMHRGLLSLFLSLLVGGANSSTDSCHYALEILLIQDGSSSFEKMIKDMGNSIAQLVSSLNAEFGQVKLGASSFSDKPLPGLGFGKYGGYQVYTTDYCYKRHAALTTDTANLTSGFGDMSDHMGNGGDFPENSLEGIMMGALDKDAGWSPSGVTHNEEGLPIARIIVMVTDDIAHHQGEAHYGADIWSGRSTFGPEVAFGTNSSYMRSYINVFDAENYQTLVKLYDLERGGQTLSEAQQTQKKDLIKKLGPESFPEIRPHPGTFDAICDQTDFPSYEQVRAALASNNIQPVVLVAKPPAVAGPLRKVCNALGFEKGKEDLCLQKYYTDELITMGFSEPITGVIGSDTSSLYSELVTRISNTVDKLCLQTPAPPAETAAPGGTNAPGTKAPGYPTTTTTTEPVVAGAPIGVIAGATAGAVVGVAAIAGVLWKKFGIGALHKSDNAIAGIGQANVAEEPVDREGVQNIEASMFQ